MTNPLYFVETTSPRVRGPWFTEVDRDSNSRAAVIELIRSGEVDPVKVLEVCEDEGTCRDVTEELKLAAALRSDDFYTRSKARMQAAAFDRARALRQEA